MRDQWGSLYARGSTPTSPWQDAMGTIVHTPA